MTDQPAGAERNRLDEPNFRVGWLDGEGKAQYAMWCSEMVARVSYRTLSKMFPQVTYWLDERNPLAEIGDRP